MVANGTEFEERDEQADAPVAHEQAQGRGPDPPMGKLERLEQTKRKAHQALLRQWEHEASNPRRKPERMMRYTITVDCTFSEFEAIKTAIKGFAPGRKRYRQEEIPMAGRIQTDAPEANEE